MHFVTYKRFNTFQSYLKYVIGAKNSIIDSKWGTETFVCNYIEKLDKTNPLKIEMVN